MNSLTTILILGLLLGPMPAPSHMQDTGTKFRLAQGFEQAGDYERAAGLYRELLSRDPQNTVYFDALQRMLIQLKQYDDAVALINGRLGLTPADLNLRALLGSVYHRSGRDREAQEEWDKALGLNPASPNPYRIIAGVMIENRLLDRAAEVYRRARVACNDPNLFTIELSQLLAVSMDYHGATTELLRWLGQNPGQLAFVQGRLAAFTGKPDARKAAMDAVREALREKDDARLSELLGWLYLEGKEFSEAFEVYRNIDRLTRAQGGSLLAFADRAFKEQAFDVAARAYEEAIKAPLSAAKMPYAKFGYASTLKGMGAIADTLTRPLGGGHRPMTEASPEYRGAVAYFRSIIQEYPHSEFSAKSYYQIGTIQFEKFFDLDAARASFEKVAEEAGNVRLIRYDVGLKIGQIDVARGDTTRAARSFRPVASAPDATPDQADEANYRLAELDFFAGRSDDAIRRLQAIALNLKADYANDALRLLAFLEENAKTAPEALKQYAQAEFLSRQRKNTEAISLFQHLVQRFPGALLVDDALMRSGSLQEEAGLYQDALATYARLLTEFRESSVSLDRAQFSVAEIQEFGLKDKAAAVAAYEKLLVDHSRSVLTALARKRIRQLRGDPL
jgi:tetratricopeptide (TPR) repeat protein